MVETHCQQKHCFPDGMAGAPLPLCMTFFLWFLDVHEKQGARVTPLLSFITFSFPELIFDAAAAEEFSLITHKILKPINKAARFYFMTLLPVLKCAEMRPPPPPNRGRSETTH